MNPFEYANAVVTDIYLERMAKMLDKTYQSATRVYLNEIAAERNQQDTKWGEQNHSKEKWMAILMEEVGEVARAVLDDEPRDYRKELIQVAAVAVVMLECELRNQMKTPADTLGPLLLRVRAHADPMAYGNYKDGWYEGIDAVRKALGKM